MRRVGGRRGGGGRLSVCCCTSRGYSADRSAPLALVMLQTMADQVWWMAHLGQKTSTGALVLHADTARATSPAPVSATRMAAAPEEEARWAARREPG